MEEKIRVVVAKPGLDGHDRGAKIIARALRDAGMEVVYTGLRQTPKRIVETVLQEDAHCLCVSILSGAHNHLLPEIMELVKKEGLEKELLVLGGGIIPDDDVQPLKDIGVADIFGPGTRTEEVIDYIRQNVKPRD